VIADGRNLYNYNSMEEMTTCRYGTGRDTTPLEGFFHHDGWLYVRLLGGADPNRAKVAVSRPDAEVLLDIKGREHVVIEGLQFHAAPAVALRLGIRLHPHHVSGHIVVRDCYFLGFHRAIAGQKIRVDRPEGPVEFGPSNVRNEGLRIERNNLLAGPSIERGRPKHAPPGGLCRSAERGDNGQDSAVARRILQEVREVRRRR
jgi:hypothetical protein